MDKAMFSGEKLPSWVARIAATARSQEGKGIAALVKPAALVAAAAGRLELIEHWLRLIPPDVIERDPQLLYWAGTTALMKRPALAEEYFVQAFEMFQRRPKGGWHLLAWAGIVDTIFFQYRNLEELDRWIDWMSPAQEAMLDKLPRQPRMLVVSSMFFALAFRQPNHPRIAIWRDRAERLAETDPTSDLGTRLMAGLISDYMWRGNLGAAELVWKRSLAREATSRQSPLGAVLSCLNEATFCLHKGLLAQCLSAVERGLAASSEHNIHLWDGILHCHAASVFCSLEDVPGVRRHLHAIEELQDENVQIDEAYYRGMLCWEAFVAGNHVGVFSRSANSIAFTDGKGVPYFKAVCRIGAGIALFESGDRERGRSLLNEALLIGREIDNPVLAWIGGLFIAHMEYISGNHFGAEAALEQAMEIGRSHSLVHFFCWPRKIIARLIDRALERNLAVDYAKYLIQTHALSPGSTARRSHLWNYDVRIYTLQSPRIEFGDGRVEPLSVQFLRQIELLVALIGKEGKATPLHVVGREVYEATDFDAVASIKHVLHSLRKRFGHIVIQRNAALSIDFSKVWIDACALQDLSQEATNQLETEAWLRRHYEAHFLDNVENSPVVLGVRRRLCDQAERCVRTVYVHHIREGEHELASQMADRWGTLFPAVFSSSGRLR